MDEKKTQDEHEETKIPVSDESSDSQSTVETTNDSVTVEIKHGDNAKDADNKDSSDSLNDLMPPPSEEKSDAENTGTESKETHETSDKPSDQMTSASDSANESDEGLAPVAKPPEATNNVVAQQSAQNDGPLGAQEAIAAAAPTQSPRPEHPHRNNKKFAVIATIIIGILLAGIAVYVYMSASGNTKEDTKKANNASTTMTASQEQTTQETQTPATAADVDATSKEIDEAVQSIDDTTDFSESSISDSTLGL